MASNNVGRITQVMGAVVDVQFEFDDVKGTDVDGVVLRRVTATGLAVRFAQAA